MIDTVTLRKTACARLQSQFPLFVIRAERIHDDPCAVGIGVFNVPAESVKMVRTAIHALDEQLCDGTLLALIPLVRNRGVTARHYPEFVSSWQARPASSDLPPMARDVSSLNDAEDYGVAANQEFALAA